MGKAKLIKSTEGTKSNPEGKWYVHDQIKPFNLPFQCIINQLTD